MTAFLKKIISPKARGAFTLIEINITLLVLSVGMLGVMGLFPVGLRQGSLAINDANQVLFADHVFGLLRSNASTITDLSDWRNFPSRVVAGLNVEGGRQLRAFTDVDTTSEEKINNYLGISGNVIRYRLVITPVTKPLNFRSKLWRASLRVIDRELGDIATQPVYTTDFVFMGSPPVEEP